MSKQKKAFSQYGRNNGHQTLFELCWSEAVSSEESKLLHFVRFREKSLGKSPDLTPPPANQSESLASPGNSSQARERRTNQNSTPNPSPEGDRSDLETPVFLNFSRDNTLYKQCNPELRAPPYSCCVSIGGSPNSSLVIKTLLRLHWISAPWWSLGDFATWA